MECDWRNTLLDVRWTHLTWFQGNGPTAHRVLSNLNLIVLSVHVLSHQKYGFLSCVDVFVILSAFFTIVSTFQSILGLRVTIFII